MVEYRVLVSCAVLFVISFSKLTSLFFSCFKVTSIYSQSSFLLFIFGLFPVFRRDLVSCGFCVCNAQTESGLSEAPEALESFCGVRRSHTISSVFHYRNKRSGFV